jgi:hypothetical protein
LGNHLPPDAGRMDVAGGDAGRRLEDRVDGRVDGGRTPAGGGSGEREVSVLVPFTEERISAISRHFTEADGALEGPLSAAGIALRVANDEGSRDLRLEKGSASGLRVVRTANPLFLEEGNRLGTLPASAFVAPPGSYLFLLRKPGFEDLRLPVLLDRGGSAEARGEMLAEGTTPEGFFWIPRASAAGA